MHVLWVFPVIIQSSNYNVQRLCPFCKVLFFKRIHLPEVGILKTQNVHHYLFEFIHVLYLSIILLRRYALIFVTHFVYLEGSYYEFLRKSVGRSSEELTIAVQRMMKGMTYKIVRSR